MRRAAKRDANEPEIIDALERVGAVVTRMSQDNVPDLVVSYAGHWHLLEVKNPDGRNRVEDNQLRWANGQKAEVHYVRSAEEALRAIGASGESSA